jgi:hypothetical protein
VARRPLEREHVYFAGGRRTTQLMRDPLGRGTPIMPDRDPQPTIIARFMNGDLEPEAAAQQLAALPKLGTQYLYWSEDLYRSGDVARRINRLQAELQRLGVEPPAA